MIVRNNEALSERERRKRVINEELDAFEQRERLWRSNDRNDRARELMARSANYD
jgi:hypothetical protein